MNGLIFSYEVYHLLRPVALAYSALETQLIKCFHIRVHPGARSRSGRAHHLSRLCGSRADVIDYLSLKIERQRLVLFDKFHHALVGGIPCGVDGSGDEHPLAGLEAAYSLFVQRRDRKSVV